jgi:hypothetical protein
MSMRIRPQQRGSAFRASRLCSYLTEDEIDRIVGAQPKAAIVQRLEQALRT